MKKNWISRRGVPIHVLKKVFLMMKLTFLLTVVLQVSTWATGLSLIHIFIHNVFYNGMWYTSISIADHYHVKRY